MAKYKLTHPDTLRPQRNRMAPWSAYATGRPPAVERETAVVYVVGSVEMGIYKIGYTTNLKKRIQQLYTDNKEVPLHIAYWAEFLKRDARTIEQACIKAMRKFPQVNVGEYFALPPQVLAEHIEAHASLLGLSPKASGGMPWAVEQPQSEIGDVLEEEADKGAFVKGKAPRFEWATFYCE